MNKLFVPVVVACLMFGCGGGGSGGSGSPSGAPSVTTSNAASLSAVTANLSGIVTANGTQASVWFEWGTTAALPSYNSTSPQTVDSSAINHSISAEITGLTAGATYYFRIAASNSYGTSKGTILNYTHTAKPTVTTLTATSVGLTAAVLNGNVSSNGLPTNVWFTWGIDPTLGNNSNTSFQPISSETTNQAVSDTITGLTPGVTYYYRITATNNSGTTEGNIQSFTAVTPWNTAVLIENGAGDAGYPDVGVDNSGNAIAVWAQADDTGKYDIWANRYVAASEDWGTAILIENGAGDAWAPKITADLSGNAIAVWQQRDSTGRYRIWANRYTISTGSWGTSLPIDPAYLTGDSSNPEVAVDGSGNFVVVWLQGTDIWANRLPSSSGIWDTAVQVETNSSEGVQDVKVGMNFSGDAVAVWAQGNIPIFNICASHYSSSTKVWGSPEIITSGPFGRERFPQVGIDGLGNAIAVWYQWNSTRLDIKAARYKTSNGIWDMLTSITSGTGNALYPRIAMDNAGNAVTVWREDDGTRYNNWSNIYRASTGYWGAAMQIEAGFLPTGDPDIAMDGSGNATSVWYQRDDTGRFNIWSNRYTASTGTWGTMMLVDLGTGEVFGPEIAVSSAGKGTAVWRRWDGTRFNIWASSFK